MADGNGCRKSIFGNMGAKGETWAGIVWPRYTDEDDLKMYSL
jgi:hypothetical protein